MFHPPPVDALVGISYRPPLTDPFFLFRDNWKMAYRIDALEQALIEEVESMVGGYITYLAR